MNELDAYDNMGLAYYYLGNLNKAIYYHNRMMSGILEGNTDVKAWNIGLLDKDRGKKTFKESTDTKSMFRDYKLAKEHDISFNYPHSNLHELHK